jgi:NAD(P)-dependent dehydrogenase (short-subunit alcohol dehydrogenase family)
MDYLVNRFDRVPMRRLVKPEAIAAACAYLASDDASAVTGIDLTVDCGLTANWYILETLEHAG